MMQTVYQSTSGTAVGLKVNGSCRMVGGNEDLIQFVTKNFSTSLDNIGLTDIGWNFPNL